MELGIALSSEENSPADLVRHARAAEEAGLGFGLISDHIHPWVDAQGHSPFVWSVLGAVAQTTQSFRIGTGVTCPLIRIHPAIVAHATATVACLMPGRFFLGVGSGENLNEHVLGAKWPAPDERLEMLEEAVALMRQLWQGDYQTHRGKHYTVENLRIFDLPEKRIDVAVAAMQPQAAKLAGEIGDALINVAPKREIVQNFDEGGGSGKPKYGQLTVCWAKSKEEAKKTAFENWPNALVEGSASQSSRCRRTSSNSLRIARPTSSKARSHSALTPMSISSSYRSTTRRDTRTSASTRSAPTKRGFSSSPSASW